MKNFFPFILLLLITATAANLFAQSGARDEKAKNDIRRVMEDQTAAWNRGDIEGFMRGYWNSPELKFVSGANVTKGWQPTLDRYKKNYDSRAKMGTLEFSDLEITILSKDAAVVLGTWKLTREADAPGGKFTLVFRKFKDGWRIVHDHTS
jgi:ketosteroid isomerase-like protein